MRQKTAFLVAMLFSVFFIVSCGKDSGPFADYEDDKMIGTVLEVTKNEDKIVVDISEWEKRDRKGPNMTDEGYSYTAKITEETVIKHENGTEASIHDMKNGQKVLIIPPRGNNFEGYPQEIILLAMTYKEKYSRFLSHVDGYNIVVMSKKNEELPQEMQEQMYQNVMGILKNKEAVAAWIEYDENYAVDYKKELGIEAFPVILVFNKEEVVLKHIRLTTYMTSSRI